MFRTPVPRAFLWRQFRVRQMGFKCCVTSELHLTSHCIFLWKMDIMPTSWGFLWLMYNNVLKHLVRAWDISAIQKSPTNIPKREPEILGREAGPLSVFCFITLMLVRGLSCAHRVYI